MRNTFEELREKFKDNFKEHEVLYYNQGERLEHLVWGIPALSNGYMEFIVSRSTLLVKGDYGDAVYEWYGKGHSLKWLAETDLDYFAGKCEASEYGREFKSWDAEQLRKDLEDLLDDYSKNFDDYGYESPNEVREKFNYADGFWAAQESELQWNHWLYENAYDVFGDDWWECVPDGKYLDVRCMLHWVGLKLAVEAVGSLAKKSADLFSFSNLMGHKSVCIEKRSSYPHRIVGLWVKASETEEGREVKGQLMVFKDYDNEEEWPKHQGPFDLTVSAYDPGIDKNRSFKILGVEVAEDDSGTVGATIDFIAHGLVPWRIDT